MKAELKGIHSPDTDLTDNGAEQTVDTILVQLMIGPENTPEAEAFDLLVCTPEGRARSGGSSELAPDEFTLVLDRIDTDLIRRHVENFLRDLERPTWEELVAEIGRIGRWEFRDYHPDPDESA
ncbi:Imm8 family immunity protein [Nocardia paucivorans]|uniref:Imm8 family immunity protein n=1 Tax=Nocardia paucivorans TaxID=114259 RepID=UPI0002E837DB|nr:Imm8 family immunity protein [Nocardia paucivorans]